MNIDDREPLDETLLQTIKAKCGGSPTMDHANVSVEDVWALIDEIERLTEVAEANAGLSRAIARAVQERNRYG